MANVTIPNLGAVNFPDSMRPEEIQKHAGRLKAIHDISKRTPSVDVTRSLPFARQLVAKYNAPAEVKHFVDSAQKLPDGRYHVDFATGRHALKAAQAMNSSATTRSEFVRELTTDLHEGTGRAGTRADWIEAEGRQ